MIPAVQTRITSLRNYVQRVTAPDIDAELGGYLFKYGAVLICGTIERCLEVIVLERLHKRAHPRIIRFIKAHFQRGTNYDCEAIKQLLVRFDQDWGKKFEAELDLRMKLREAISSCYAVRNSVAHGGGGSLGSARLAELAKDSIELIEVIEQITR